MELFTVNFDGKLCVLHPKRRNIFLPVIVNSKYQLRYVFYTFSYPGWSVIQINLSPRIKLGSRWWTMRRLRGVMGWREGVLRWSREKLKMAAGVKVRNGMRNNQDVCAVGWRRLSRSIARYCWIQQNPCQPAAVSLIPTFLFEIIEALNVPTPKPR